MATATGPHPNDRPLVFVSYSQKDTRWKDELLPHLIALQLDEQLEVWHDGLIDTGGKWRDDIETALARSAAAICMVSKHFLATEFIVKEEVRYFLEQANARGVPILPILLSHCPWQSIRWIKEIQMIPSKGRTIADDHKRDYDKVFAELANRVSVIASDLSNKLAATPGMPRTSAGRLRPPTLAHPPQASIDEEISELPWPEEVENRIDIGRLPVTGAEVFGRQTELALLDEAWESEKTNIVTLIAWGGVGKSTLVNRWLETLRADNWRGAGRVLGWSFYSQGTGDRASSADPFIGHALRFFGDLDPVQGSPWAKGERLAELVRKAKALLVLDGLEPLQDPYQGVKDPGLQRLIEELARDNSGLCVITTREPVKELADFSASTVTRDLEQISPEAGRALLRVKGVRGADIDLERVSAAFGNHALAISLLANFLRAIPGHPIAKAWKIADLDIPPEQGRHPRRVMAAFAARFGGDSAEVEMLRLIGLFDRPASAGAITALGKPPPIARLTDHLSALGDAGWTRVLEILRDVGLVGPKSYHTQDEIDTHPLLREHFGAELREKNQEAWRAGHERLYEYFQDLPREYQPETLEELAPLFQSIFHGCEAGNFSGAYHEIYRARVRRENEQYITRKFGAFGANLSAISGFFSGTWQGPVSELDAESRAWLLSEAGFCLAALGRLKEAVPPMRASLDMGVAMEGWRQAAIRAGNLSELKLTLGSVAEAIALAEQGVDYADRAGDWDQRVFRRTTLADALHQGGDLKRSQSLFAQAERLQADARAHEPRLYSFRGYQYCDLLLDFGCHAEVRLRAAQTLEWALLSGQGSLLDIALDHLSLGRAELLAHGADRSGDLIETESRLRQAVDGLRRAGQIQELPRGLLARAAYFRVDGQYERARRDLDEAIRIATRCGMRLFECDARLELARLATAERAPGTAPDHLARAAELVEQTGYHRRDEDLKRLQVELGERS